MTIEQDYSKLKEIIHDTAFMKYRLDRARGDLYELSLDNAGFYSFKKVYESYLLDLEEYKLHKHRLEFAVDTFCKRHENALKAENDYFTYRDLRFRKEREIGTHTDWILVQ